MMAVRGKEDPAAQWAAVQTLYPEAGHWCDQGQHYGALRRHDPVAREYSLPALIDVLLGRELPGPAV